MAEIKISELSIGDWISDKNGIVAQVRGIECWSDGYVVNVRTKAGTITNLTVGGVLPIPLLPKILEKNGWNKIVRNIKYQTWVKGDIYIRKYSAEEWYRLFIGRFEMKFNLYHTHQLQHALRLAGVEKEIEL